MDWTRKHLLGLAGVTAEEITTILDTADSMKDISLRPIKKVPTLRGRTVVLFFYEPSTRTKTSFELACKRLSADSVALAPKTSSLTKGETLIDTVQTLEAMSPDIVVIRHSSSGAPHFLTRHTSVPIINAGDGTHEHPTQSLLDMMTIREQKGRIDGLNVAIIGDITHSRVARSNVIGLKTMGAKVRLYGPPTLLPPYVETLGAEVAGSMDEAVERADVVMMLRVQQERLSDVLFPSLREYSRLFGLNAKLLSSAAPDAIVMHPGPINRGVEIAPDVADAPQSVILNQVTNGVAVRMALLYLLIGAEAS